MRVDRPTAEVALAALEATAAPHVLVVCADRHHRLARLYPTPSGVLTEILVRGTRGAVAWLPDERGVPVAPACKCHMPTHLLFYAEPFNYMAAVLDGRPANVEKFRLLLREVGRLPCVDWVDRQGKARPMLMPSELGLPPLMEHLARGGRVSLAVQ